MKIDIIVTRHKAAVEFVAEELVGSVIDHTDGTLSVQVDDKRIPVQSSVTPADVAGKVVAGNLPLSLAAEADVVYAIEFAGRPPRGAEYGLEEMRAAGARLVPYRVSRVGG